MSKFDLINLTLSNGNEWFVAKAQINPENEIFKKAKEQARKKSTYTMNASQSGSYRSPEFKFNRQLMGTLAEIYVQEFLIEALEKVALSNKWQIIRYDDVRTDGFKSPENEYDIKASKCNGDGQEYFIESRSSIVKDRTLEQAIDSFHIIGAYKSVAKFGENPNDFYILPLHLVVNKKSNYLPSKYEEYILNGYIEIYIVSGCSNNFIEKNGRIDNLNQGQTNYKVLKASAATNSLLFQKRFGQFLT